MLMFSGGQRGKNNSEEEKLSQVTDNELKENESHLTSIYSYMPYKGSFILLYGDTDCNRLSVSG